MLWLRVGKLSQVSPLPTDTVHKQDWRDNLQETATSLLGYTQIGGGQEGHPQGRPLGTLWHCQSRAGTAATIPHPKTTWVHTHDPDLPLPRSPLVLVVLVLSVVKGKVDRAEVPGNRGSWH